MAKKSEPNGIGLNSKTLTEEGKTYVERIESVLAAIDLEREKAKEAIAPLRVDIKAMLDGAEFVGLTKKSIRAIVKARELERKADAARTALDMADQSTFDNIRLALGDYADTALGQFALGAAPKDATHGA